LEREIIVIAGPTASGKTDLAIETAERLNTEIISADSRQFYKYLDIGTAKPSDDQLKRVKHHLISFLEPADNYNVSLFRKDALEICGELWSRGKIPVVAGGSGLYIRALVKGLSDTPDPDESIRERLLREKEEYGADYLYNKLKEIDPVSTENMLPQNWKRVMRALEVFYITGIPISAIHEQSSKDNELNAVKYGIMRDREELYGRINKRVDDMFKAGLVDEVKSLLDKKYDSGLNSLNTVGYKEVIQYLNNEITLERAVELIKRNTRRYAKRQITWFRKEEGIIWQTIKTNEDLLIFAESIAKRFNS
jgi:tRNA dimethylallyltransferase